MRTSYTAAFKEHALSKVYSRGERTILAVAEELNINVLTLKNWMKKAVSDKRTHVEPKARSLQDWRPEERLAALRASHGLEGEALNAWCRERGLFAHQLAQWQEEFCQAVGADWGRESQRELRTLKEENQRLQREVARKDKALAEAAALLVLQKKFQALLGGEVA